MIDLSRYDNIIYNLFIDINKRNHKSSKYNKYVQNKTKYSNITYYFHHRFDNELCNPTVVLYCLENNIYEWPICKVCGEQVKFRSPTYGFNIYCNTKCQMNDKTVERKHTFNHEAFRKWLDSRTDEDWKRYSDKAKQTKLERYGDENYFNYEKSLETKLERYGKKYLTKEDYKSYDFHWSEEQKKAISEERKQYWANENNRKESGNKLKENWANRTEEEKEAKIEKFKDTWYSHSEEWLNEYKDKVSKSVKKHLDNLTEDEKRRRVNKMLLTKDINNTHNTSVQETECYEYVKEIFTDIIKQYSSAEYPFKCDFYIPSLDVYIEYQGTWTHGGHPFDPSNEEDKTTLEKFRMKNTKYYNTAIQTWSIRDPLKRKIAKENNLKWFEVWNVNEFKDLINQLKQQEVA